MCVCRTFFALCKNETHTNTRIAERACRVWGMPFVCVCVWVREPERAAPKWSTAETHTEKERERGSSGTVERTVELSAAMSQWWNVKKQINGLKQTEKQKKKCWRWSKTNTQTQRDTHTDRQTVRASEVNRGSGSGSAQQSCQNLPNFSFKCVHVAACLCLYVWVLPQA